MYRFIASTKLNLSDCQIYLKKRQCLSKLKYNFFLFQLPVGQDLPNIFRITTVNSKLFTTFNYVLVFLIIKVSLCFILTPYYKGVLYVFNVKLRINRFKRIAKYTNI